MKNVYYSNDDTIISLCESVIEFRIFFKIIEEAQIQIPSGRVYSKLYNKWDIKEVTFNPSDISSNNNNRKVVNDVLKKMRKIEFVYTDKEGREKHTGIIHSYRTLENGKIEMIVDWYIWNIILDFTRGFKVLNPEIYRNLKKRSSIILYFILCSKDNGYTEKMPIDKIRKIFGIDDKYQNVAEIERRLIIPALNELDEKSDFSFNYKKVKSGKNVIRFDITKRSTDNEVSRKISERKGNRYMTKRINKGFINKEIYNAFIDAFDGSEYEVATLSDKMIEVGEEYLNKILKKIDKVRNKAEEKGKRTSDIVRILISKKLREKG